MRNEREAFLACNFFSIFKFWLSWFQKVVPDFGISRMPLEIFLSGKNPPNLFKYQLARICVRFRSENHQKGSKIRARLYFQPFRVSRLLQTELLYCQKCHRGCILFDDFFSRTFARMCACFHFERFGCITFHEKSTFRNKLS